MAQPFYFDRRPAPWGLETRQLAEWGILQLFVNDDVLGAARADVYCRSPYFSQIVEALIYVDEVALLHSGRPEWWRLLVSPQAPGFREFDGLEGTMRDANVAVMQHSGVLRMGYSFHVRVLL